MLPSDVSSFVTFLGTVVDIDDPLQLGRVRVREINQHSDSLGVEDINWATIIQPTTSPAVKGQGSSPTWLQVGSLVVGFYLDGGNRSAPMIMGTIATIPGNDVANHGVSSLARGEARPRNTIGPEPKSTYAAKYPYNKVIETPGGHVVELDDTPDAQRISVQHSSGTYIDISKDGDVIVKSTRDSYNISEGSATQYAEGDISLKGKKNATIVVDGKYNITVKGDCNITSSGTVNIKGARINLN
jgi:hypothetical protein